MTNTRDLERLDKEKGLFGSQFWRLEGLRLLVAFLLKAPRVSGHHKARDKEHMFMSSGASPLPIIYSNLIMGLSGDL